MNIFINANNQELGSRYPGCQSLRASKDEEREKGIAKENGGEKGKRASSRTVGTRLHFKRLASPHFPGFFFLTLFLATVQNLATQIQNFNELCAIFMALEVKLN